MTNPVRKEDTGGAQKEETNDDHRIHTAGEDGSVLQKEEEH